MKIQKKTVLKLEVCICVRPPNTQKHTTQWSVTCIILAEPSWWIAGLWTKQSNHPPTKLTGTHGIRNIYLQTITQMVYKPNRQVILALPFFFNYRQIAPSLQHVRLRNH